MLSHTFFMSLKEFFQLSILHRYSRNKKFAEIFCFIRVHIYCQFNQSIVIDSRWVLACSKDRFLWTFATIVVSRDVVTCTTSNLEVQGAALHIYFEFKIHMWNEGSNQRLSITNPSDSHITHTHEETRDILYIINFKIFLESIKTIIIVQMVQYAVSCLIIRFQYNLLHYTILLTIK